jgi:hypothetical protein
MAVEEYLLFMLGVIYLMTWNGNAARERRGTPQSRRDGPSTLDIGRLSGEPPAQEQLKRHC